MSHLLDVVVQNKELFLALAALAVSEMLPFVKSSRWNGVLQGIVTVLKDRAARAKK